VGHRQHKRAEWPRVSKSRRSPRIRKPNTCFTSAAPHRSTRKNKIIAQNTAKILKAAGVNFAILGEEEMCCGETARRIGNEYLSLR